MKKFKIEIEANASYEVVAENEDEAVDIALGWFDDYMPDVFIEEIVYGN